jgi:uncharacterized protein (TIGR00106 family)
VKITAMLSILPIGTEVSLSRYVAACEEVLIEAGLPRALHAHGTNVEGEYDVVMAAVRRCIEKVHEMGCPRLAVLLKLGSRIDREPDGERAIRSVEEKLSGES